MPPEQQQRGASAPQSPAICRFEVVTLTQAEKALAPNQTRTLMTGTLLSLSMPNASTAGPAESISKAGLKESYSGFEYRQFLLRSLADGQSNAACVNLSLSCLAY